MSNPYRKLPADLQFLLRNLELAQYRCGAISSTSENTRVIERAKLQARRAQGKLGTYLEDKWKSNTRK